MTGGMDAVTLVALPIFALVFSGYGARRLGLLGEASIAGLNGAVSLALAVIEIGLGGGGRWPSVARTAALGLARNPLIVAAFAGAALPCSLFALGAALVGRFAAAGRPHVLTLIGLKLVAHPSPRCSPS